MNISKAYQLAGEPEPPPEEHVDLTCTSCAGMWCSSARGKHHITDSEDTVYKHYIGNENCEMNMGRDDQIRTVYHCPNGCGKYGLTTIRHMDDPEDLTPHREWQLANLLVRQDKLQDQLTEVEEELRGFGHYS